MTILYSLLMTAVGATLFATIGDAVVDVTRGARRYR